MSKSRNWITTINNPEVLGDLSDYVKAYVTAGAQFSCGQLEKGESGTPHLQIYSYWPNQARGAQLSKVCKASHNEPCRDGPASMKYCMKEDTRVDGPWQFGEPPKANGRPLKSCADFESLTQQELWDKVTPAQYNQFQKALQHKMLTQENSAGPAQKTKGVWYYGKSGIGKSYGVRRKYPDLFLKNQSKWWDGYSGQKFILLDDFDKKGECLDHYLKIWADCYPCTGEVKGYTCNLNYEKFIITSQYLPSEIFTDEKVVDAITRRFELIEVTLANRMIIFM